MKGNSPGVNSGNHDFKFEVQSGNYQTSDFVIYLNKSLKDLTSMHNDVDFGTTMITYNLLNSKLSLTIDIKITYNETNY